MACARAGVMSRVPRIDQVDEHVRTLMAAAVDARCNDGRVGPTGSWNGVLAKGLLLPSGSGLRRLVGPRVDVVA